MYGFLKIKYNWVGGGGLEENVSPATDIPIIDEFYFAGTENERACSSPTRLAVAIASRNNAFLVLLRKEAFVKGSNGGPDKYSSTLSKSHVGDRCIGRGAEISKERVRSLRIGDVEISSRQNLKTEESMDL